MYVSLCLCLRMCVFMYIYIYVCIHICISYIGMYIHRYLYMVPLPKYQEVFHFEVFIAMIMSHFILHIINIKRQILGLFKLFNPS